MVKQLLQLAELEVVELEQLVVMAHLAMVVEPVELE
jgi:hypothetical protein